MAIIKTRKHNDDPSLIVVELYDDQGEFVADTVGFDYMADIAGMIQYLLTTYPAPLNYCTSEQLIS